MTVDWGLATGALLVAALHALLPTHWMPFLLVGRAQGWRPRQVLGVVAVAGLGHAVVTCLLGLLCAWIGEKVIHHLEGFEVPFMVAVMGGFGAWFLWQGQKKARCHGHAHEVNLSDRTAAVSLILMISLQPCGAAMPLFLNAGPLVPLPVIIGGSLAVSGVTVLIMLALTSASLAGSKPLQGLEWVEHNEKLIVGVLFLLLAAGAALFHGVLETALSHLHALHHHAH